MTRIQEMKANLQWAFDNNCNCKMCQWVRAYRADLERIIREAKEK